MRTVERTVWVVKRWDGQGWERISPELSNLNDSEHHRLAAVREWPLHRVVVVSRIVADYYY